MMEKELLASGYPAARMEIIVDEPKAIDHALKLARRGDLLLVFGDKPSRCWKQIIYFKPDGDEHAATSTSAPVVEEPARASAAEALLGDAELIQDERGVRLARESGD